MGNRYLMTLVRLLGFAGALTALAAPTAKADPLPLDSGKLFVIIHGQTNDYRKIKGLSRLDFAPSVAKVAQAYAEYLAANNLTGHNADGRNAEQRLQAAGFKAGVSYCGWAENFYEISTTAAVPTWHQAGTAAVAWWKQSPGHDAHLRSPDMTSMGVGSAAASDGGRNYVKIVQLFIDDCGDTGPRTKTLGKRK
jgi:uncharacterized protein YkwD